MKEVTLYTIKEEKKIVVGDYLEVEYASRLNKPSNIRSSNEFTISPKLDRESLPIEKFISNNGISEKVSYVCFSKELREIVNIKLEDYQMLSCRNIQLEESLKAQEVYTETLKKEKSGMMDKINRLENMSFLQRLKFLFLGSKYVLR